FLCCTFFCNPLWLKIPAPPTVGPGNVSTFFRSACHFSFPFTWGQCGVNGLCISVIRIWHFTRTCWLSYRCPPRGHYICLRSAWVCNVVCAPVWAGVFLCSPGFFRYYRFL